MKALLWMGTAAVAGGLGTAVVGLGRAAAAGAASRESLALVDDGGPSAQRSELSLPFVVRFLGPAWNVLEQVSLRCTPVFWVDRLKRSVRLAGLGTWGIEGILAMKGAFALGGALLIPVFMALTGRSIGSVLVWVVLGAAGGFFVPDVWVSRRGRQRQDEIRRSLPEALDLMAIAVQAGSGLETAIALVAQRLQGPLGEELNRLLQEVQLGSSRREALHNLRDRTDVSELSTFSLALAQADTLGTPLGEVLRVQAGEMRMLRRQRAREKAAKTPVKLLLPLLVGIFPALGVVIMGPAVISIARAFSG